MNFFTAPRSKPLLALAAAALLVGACGYPTFSFVPAGTTSTTGESTTTTGTGGAGGTGGGSPGTGGDPATSSISSAASSGTGGGPACVVTHKGLGTCEYLPGSECGCPDPTTKCAVIDEETGASDCIKIGMSPHPAWSSCDTDNDCGVGTWCDLQRHVCKPICNTIDECPDGAHCVPVPRSTGVMTIPSLKACTSHCDPESAAPCGSGLTCFHDSADEFDCEKSQSKVQGAPCQASADCFKGLLCIGSGQTYTCEQWCHPVNAPGGGCVGAKSYCSSFQMAVMYNSAIYGYCVDPTP